MYFKNYIQNDLRDVITPILYRLFHANDQFSVKHNKFWQIRFKNKPHIQIYSKVRVFYLTKGKSQNKGCYYAGNTNALYDF